MVFNLRGDDDYPKLHLGAFFEPIDLSIPPRMGELCLKPNNLGQGVSILPKRWADDPLFWNDLSMAGESQTIFRASQVTTLLMAAGEMTKLQEAAATTTSIWVSISRQDETWFRQRRCRPESRKR